MGRLYGDTKTTARPKTTLETSAGLQKTAEKAGFGTEAKEIIEFWDECSKDIIDNILDQLK